MSTPSIAPWAIHVAGFLICGALAWGLGRAIHKTLRISHGARNYWFGIWMLAVLPPVAAVLLEGWAQVRITAMPVLPLPLPFAGDSGEMDASVIPLTSSHASLLPSLSVLLVSVYLAGVVVAGLRWLAGILSVWGIVAAAQPVDPTAWPGAASAREARGLCLGGTVLLVTQRAMSPFAVRWPRPAIVLPADAFPDLNDRQLRLVVRHEAAHLSQRDPQRKALMALVGTFLWFNPFVRLIAGRVQMAAELHCDALALEGDKSAGRELAGAYLHTLRRTASADGPTPAMSLTHRNLDGHRLRLGHMLNGDPGRTPSMHWHAMSVAAALAIGSILTVVQIAAASPMKPQGIKPVAVSPGVATTTAFGGSVHHSVSTRAPESSIRFTSPISSPRITGHFGDAGGIRKRPHRGTDFGARRGTPVLAPAAGLVVAATQRYRDAPNYGTVVVLDHGDGWQTLFAHLEGHDVRVGQRVEAGDQIARVGNTGKVTGAHLHFETLLSGRRVDPESLLR